MNLTTGVINAGRAGLADRLDSDARIKQERINALLGQAYGDPSQRQASLGQVAQIDAGAALGAEEAMMGRDDRINKARVGISRTFLAMPPEARGRFVQQYGRDFQNLGLDPMAPDFEHVATGYANAGSDASSDPAAVQVFRARAKAAGLVEGTPDYQRAAQVELGLSPRAIPAGYTTRSYRDANGQEVVELVQIRGQGAGGSSTIGGAAPSDTPAGGLQPDSIDQAIANIEAQEGPLPGPVKASLRTQMQRGGPFLVNGQTGASASPSGPGRGQSDSQRASAAAEQAAAIERAKLSAQAELTPKVAAAEARAVRLSALPNVVANADQTIALIDKAISHPGRAIATGMSGAFGLGSIPGTEGADFTVLLNQIKGKAFLEAFQSLKGGGAITQVEGTKAEQAIARLETAQTEGEFLSGLKDLRDVVAAGRTRAIDMASGAPAQQAPQNDDDISDLLQQYGDNQ